MKYPTVHHRIALHFHTRNAPPFFISSFSNVDAKIVKHLQTQKPGYNGLFNILTDPSPTSTQPPKRFLKRVADMKMTIKTFQQS